MHANHSILRNKTPLPETRLFLLFLRVLSTKRLKSIERALFWNAKEHYQKIGVFFCDFEYLAYQNHRTHAKQPV